MTDDVLDRLRRANPVADDIDVPSLHDIRSHVMTAKRPRGRRTGSGWLIPTLAVGVAIAVAVVAVALVGGRPRHASTATTSAPAQPRPHPQLRAPRGGMRGGIDLVQASFGAGGDGAIGFDQCLPCHPATHGADVAFHGWIAVIRNGQIRWIHQLPFTIDDLTFSGRRDGWAAVTDRAVNLYVTHDGGLTWYRASMIGTSSLASSVSVAGGEAWASTIACLGSCPVHVLRGAASGNTLRATAAVPGPGGAAVAVRAVSAMTAYLETVSERGGAVHDYVTHDGGSSWNPITTVCAARVSTAMEVAGTSVWESCPIAGQHTPTKLAVSSDGGRHWTTHPLPNGGLLRLWPFSAQVAWTMSVRGAVFRTTDGGAHWQTVFSGGPVPRGTRASVVAFSAQSARTATVVCTLTGGPTRSAKRTNLIVYRTTDAGLHWNPTVIALPRG